MKDVSEIVGFLYSKFLLRDVMAKVVPGGILLSTTAGILAGVNPRALGDYIFLLEGRHLIMLFPLAWVAGFASQSLCQFCGLFWRPEREEHDRILRVIQLSLRRAPQAAIERLERFNVILEATSNTAIAVSIFAAAFYLNGNLRGAIALILMIPSALLWREHWITVQRYLDWQDRVLGRNPNFVRPCWFRWLMRLIRGWNS